MLYSKDHSTMIKTEEENKASMLLHGTSWTRDADVASRAALTETAMICHASGKKLLLSFCMAMRPIPSDKQSGLSRWSLLATATSLSSLAPAPVLQLCTAPNILPEAERGFRGTEAEEADRPSKLTFIRWFPQKSGIASSCIVLRPCVHALLKMHD